MKKIHLAWFGSVPPVGWKAPTSQLYDWRKPELYLQMARLCEQAKFDMVLFGDTLAVSARYQDSIAPYVRSGATIHHDPVPVIAMMGAVTSRVGLASTLSTTFYPPYLLARMVGTLDHLTSGRIGWNVVTTSAAEAAQNFGFETLVPHDERYDMADEYMDLCRQLWDSWEPDAMLMDHESGVFADPSKVHAVNFSGKYFKSRGPLTVVSSPQRHPVIIVAGTSPRGQRFAIANGEVVIAHKNTVADMKAYTKGIRRQLEEAGRDPRSIKVFFSIKPIMGDTESIAKEKRQLRLERADIEVGLSDMSFALGHDMSKFDLDKPLPSDLKVDAIRGKLTQLQAMGRDITLREIARHESLKETFEICGSYEQVADIIQATAEEVDADGFHFREGPAIDLGYLLEVATRLLPILQKRGVARTEYTGSTLREHLNEF